MQIGQAIKQIRKHKKMLQAQLSEKTGISHNSICSFEKGNTVPHAKNFDKICKALKVSKSAVYFLCIDEQDIAPEKRESFQVLHTALKQLIIQ